MKFVIRINAIKSNSDCTASVWQAAGHVPRKAGQSLVEWYRPPPGQGYKNDDDDDDRHNNYEKERLVL